MSDETVQASPGIAKSRGKVRAALAPGLNVKLVRRSGGRRGREAS